MRGLARNKIMFAFGRFLIFIGNAGFYITAIWGLILELAILHNLAGFWGLFLGIVLFPITMLAVPWYAVFALGDWLPFILIYVGAVVTAIIYALGKSIWWANRPDILSDITELDPEKVEVSQEGIVSDWLAEEVERSRQEQDHQYESEQPDTP